MTDPLLATLLQSTHDATWIADGLGVLTNFNHAFVRLYAETRGSVPTTGVDARDLFDTVWPDLFERTMSGRSVSMGAAFSVGGAQRQFSLAGAPVIRDNVLLGAVFTARELREPQYHARQDLFELSLTRLFIENDRPLAATLHSAIEYLCASDEWDTGVIWLLGDDTSALQPAAIYTSSGLAHGDELHTQLRAIRFAPGVGLPGRAWASDEMVWIADISDESNIARGHLAQRLALRGAVALPLRDGARVVGVLELFTRDVRPLSDVQSRALLHTASGLGRLIERRRADDERRRLLQVIERKGLEWSLTFDAIELPIFITSTEGIVRRMNRAGRDLAGADYDDVLGRRMRSLGSGEPWATLAACIEAVRDSGQTCSAQAHDPASDRFWDIAANSYKPADDPPRTILIAREITSVVRLQTAVRRGEQLAALGELVAGVAHEVRNPIFGLQLTVDSLEAALPKDDADIADLVVMLRRWLERLNGLMESLLAYGRAWTADLREGSLDDVLQQAIFGTQPAADAAGVTVRSAIRPAAPVLMDASRLMQAFENLVINAIQHSKSKSEVVIESDERDGFIECSVRDHGPGFAAEDLPRIFEPFFTRRRGGTGLGLAIVQRIIEEHGGTLHAANAENGGAIVTVRLPVFTKNTP